jgi:hypothetical protein
MQWAREADEFASGGRELPYASLREMRGGAAHLPYRSMREFTGHTERDREHRACTLNTTSSTPTIRTAQSP